MLAASDLRALRKESAKALRQLQQLPGFAARFGELPRLPPHRSHWSWAALLRGSRGEDPGSFRWIWRPAHELEADDPTSLSMARQLNRIERDDEGHELALVPVPDGVPDDPDELCAYRSSVERFAAEIVFGAEWSARAVHDALRQHRPIQLPQAPHQLVATPVTANPRVGDALPGGAADTLAEALKRGAVHPEQQRLRREHGKRQHKIRRWLAAPDTIAPRRHDWLEAMERLDELDGAGERKLGEARREAMWEGALEAVAHRLRNEPTSERALRYYNRAKPYLNAAANGSWQARLPVEQTDAPDYLTRIRPDQRRARQALRAYLREIRRRARRS